MDDIFTAATTGNISLFRKCLLAGQGVNTVNPEGQTPLVVASVNGHTQLVKFILARSPNKSITDAQGLTALDYAKKGTDSELINALRAVTVYAQREDAYENYVLQLAGNIFGVLNDLDPVIADMAPAERMALRNDVIKLMLLATKGEELTDLYYFGFSCVTTYLFSEDLEVLKKLDTISHKRLMDVMMPDAGKFEKYFDKQREGLDKARLTSLDAVNSTNTDRLRSALYEITEIIIKADGVVTPRESENLKNITSRFFTATKGGSGQPALIPATEANAGTGKDVAGTNADTDIADIFEELNSLVGLDNIKQDVHSLVNVINANKLRAAQGLPQHRPALHSVFIGAPGTGKTTIARILSNIYHKIGALPGNKMVETDRSGLVAGYVGQTAIKTDEVITSALNGILFIDEAYTLKRSDSSSNDYGQEAIDILLKRMEDHRDELIVIVAGYQDEMNVFINSNPGLKSRFSRYFYFEDYTPAQLTEIFTRIAAKAGFEFTDESKNISNQLFEKLYANKDSRFGNARLVRNIFEKTFEKHANRTATIAPITREILTTIEAADIPYNEFIGG
jgi:Holliday junction resolvasome RuvABC ATP-dependent DNA helicase subunit